MCIMYESYHVSIWEDYYNNIFSHVYNIMNRTNKKVKPKITICELRILAKRHDISVTTWAGKNKYVYKTRAMLIDDLKSKGVRVS